MKLLVTNYDSINILRILTLIKLHYQTLDLSRTLIQKKEYSDNCIYMDKLRYEEASVKSRSQIDFHTMTPDTTKKGMSIYFRQIFLNCLPNDCISLHYYQQCKKKKKKTIVLHAFLIFANFMGKKPYLIILDIFLIISEVEHTSNGIGYLPGFYELFDLML